MASIPSVSVPNRESKYTLWFDSEISTIPEVWLCVFAAVALTRQMRTLYETSGLLMISPILMAASLPEHRPAQDAIKSQQGCYQVTFQYEEVEAHQPNYALAAPKQSQVMELITVDEDSPNKIVMQHVLVTPPRIKHWKQIWRFEQGVFDQYAGPDIWKQTNLDDDEVEGTWTQEVRGVADNPRYGCAAPWLMAEEAVWTCETWAPKPRRDKDRADYNVLKRTNTHRIHNGGWVHEQKNTKIMVNKDGVTPIVTEVGRNTYDRINDADCQKAEQWWEKRKSTWNVVQRAWDESSKRHQTYKVHPKQGVFPLWIRLFWLARKPLPEDKHPKLQSRVQRTIDRHLVESSVADQPGKKDAGM